MYRGVQCALWTKTDFLIHICKNFYIKFVNIKSVIIFALLFKPAEELFFE